jgi:hypothetical protein
MSLAAKIASTDRQIRDMQLRIREQKVRLDRLIVQGFPTQPLVDAVRHLEARLLVLQQHRRSINIPDRIG